MDLHDKEMVPGDILPVVIIGNGPSGICLSHLLSGHTPYLSPEAWHPNPLLHGKLSEQPHLPLMEQDLEYLCEGLEGRSSNPVAVLFDSLLLPDSDFGLDHTSPLEWRYEPERAVPHLVLGKGPPGGAWHAMEGSMLTLSLANWMELPGLKLKDWMRDKRRNVRNDRATPAEIASYYQHYVSQMSLGQNFACGTTVTAVTREHGGRDGSPPCWRVSGLQQREGEDLGDGSAVSEEVPFSLLARNVVLATGTHDIPARLGVPGESLPFVCHSFWELEAAISGGELDQSSDPVLVVGAGLTAADAVLAAHHLNTPVYHAFRRSVADPGLIFNQLPKLLYPEYHKVHQMMTQQQHQPTQERTQNLHPDPSSSSPSPPSSSYTGYLSFPRHRVVAFRPDRKCVLESDSGEQTVVRVSKALVLIGSHPNLSFLRDTGRSLGANPDDPISCRRNPIDVDPFTNRVLAADGPGLYAMGPLVGENFVRFLKGGALAIASDLAKRRREEREAAGADRQLDGRGTSRTAAEVLDS
ncbi:oxidative stress induced growth inhibitor 1 isoform X2 [Kryptolebias marmoratus]|uniref:Oxidative stress-induced growth inhibitor 1 n=2 Tax=Kryptolebias marmoratus TaxID=37003 RepID=A0A3Q3B9R7_KRYMA|nr:oxidative stress induced growth inhibitor 1 isoform X2 [Kryptolebias marmoratus]XP_024857947.1 oxidative stress induced growth inhibitor 1 isoform X2 [Kryptolebias marmoratus]XP_037831410.1 oxidative stress induced growth inhibitor 1 isoform X2 [Kryptolebias marmoratus]